MRTYSELTTLPDNLIKRPLGLTSTLGGLARRALQGGLLKRPGELSTYLAVLATPEVAFFPQPLKTSALQFPHPWPREVYLAHYKASSPLLD
jgi:hypothetical protein